MIGTTLQSTVRDRTPAVNRTPQKATTRDGAAKTQDFGDLLGKAAQMSAQADKAGVDSAKVNAGSKNTEAAAEKKPMELFSMEKSSMEKSSMEKSSIEKDSIEKTSEEADKKSADAVEKDAGTENVAAEEQAVDAEPEDGKTAETDEAAEVKPAVPEETVDEMTAEEIARALEQIIGQIKQILGITDEELLAGMEKAGMSEFDLMNPDNMTKLVTAVSGNDSAISLVADEKLYAALQDISGLVEAKVGELLDKTGLTGDELDIVLTALKEMKGAQPETTVQGQTQGLVSDMPETQTDMGTLPDGTEKAQETARPLAEEKIPTVIIKEDDAKPARQYDTLPENQQENPAETIVGAKTQSTQRETKNGDADGRDTDPKHFGQDGARQNFQADTGGVNGTAASEGIAKFVSESTENILRQLADMVKIVKNERLTEMEMQLHPASLGTVNVSLTTKGGVVTAHFTTQNETVKAAIESQAAQLQTKLEEQGVKVEAVEVSVASHGMERNLDKGGREQQSEQENTQRIQGARRRSINLRSLEEGGELEEELMGDDAARIAMEMMTANGNSMDLLV